MSITAPLRNRWKIQGDGNRGAGDLRSYFNGRLRTPTADHENIQSKIAMADFQRCVELDDCLIARQARRAEERICMARQQVIHVVVDNVTSGDNVTFAVGGGVQQ